MPNTLVDPGDLMQAVRSGVWWNNKIIGVHAWSLESIEARFGSSFSSVVRIDCREKKTRTLFYYYLAMIISYKNLVVPYYLPLNQYNEIRKMTNPTDQVHIAAPPSGSDTANMSTMKKQLLSTARQRTSEWVFSLEIPTDVTVNAGGTSFSLHKFPLVSKCGYIRKLVSKSPDSLVEIPDIPGGEEAFELVAKFCYGINFEITTQNIAMLRCVAEFLEMTEDNAVGNLIRKTETYLNEVGLKNFSGALSILHSCESLLPIAERVKLVNRCIDTISFIACKDSQFAALPNSEPILDWWAEDLTVLRFDFFQRVLNAITSRGFQRLALGPILMLYAQKLLRGLDIFEKSTKKIVPIQEHEKRVVLETIVSLLSREKNTISVSFLSMLLKAALCLETTVSCRFDLEKRIALKLGDAALDDLLIPSYSFTEDTYLDVETVQRIWKSYLESEMEGNNRGSNANEGFGLSPSSDMDRVIKLMEDYLAEISSDINLSVTKFVSLAHELIPEQFRKSEDGMYRAIDIYLKAHPALSDMERKKVCSVMDCRKLSQEACTHASQNDRLPVQTVVKVLYNEQRRLREIVDSSLSGSPSRPTKTDPSPDDVHLVGKDESSTLQKENQEMKLELVNMKMKLKETEKLSDSSSVSSSPLGANGTECVRKLHFSRKSFVSSVSKKLGRFIRAEGIIHTQDSKDRSKARKDRRHSVS